MKPLLLFICAAMFTVCRAQSPRSFFTLKPPGSEPVLFAPGVVSDEYGNRDMAISPAGDELFYTLQYRTGLFSTIMHCSKKNGKWTAPEVARFSGQYNDLEPAFSPDGTTLYFSSSRPLNGEEKKDYDIWYVKRVDGGWSLPKNAGNRINTLKNEFYASVARNGNIYFTREIEGREEDIVMCRFVNNAYDSAIALPETINSTGDEFNAFVDPDEQYILFTGYKRKDAIGTGDIYMSRKDNKGSWGEAKNLGEKINKKGLTYCPYVTPDKKYFFFSGSRNDISTPFARPQSHKDLYRLMHSPFNDYDNIYWVNAKGILN